MANNPSGYVNLQILPVSLRNVEMNASVRTCIMRVSRVFRRLCNGNVNMSKKKEYIEDANETLCMIEREFPLGSMPGYATPILYGPDYNHL
jgi:hypothetical protein